MYNVESLGLNEAELAVEATLQEVLKELKQPVAMAVVDNRSLLILYTRMDGANPFNQLMAIRKASTAALLGIDASVF
jgi:uncharacterized protein GlcG (DUF336 family)